MIKTSHLTCDDNDLVLYAGEILKHGGLLEGVKRRSGILVGAFTQLSGSHYNGTD